MSRLWGHGRTIVAGLGVGAASLMTGAPAAHARSAHGAIVLENLPSSSSAILPLDILRRVALDRALQGAKPSCADLRRCDELNLRGVSVDLDGDGLKEWFVTDLGFTGTGTELDYIFKKGIDRRWKKIGHIEGLHLMTVGPNKTRGFFDLNGHVIGICVEGRGKALWNGHQYVGHESRVKPRSC